MNSEVLEKIGTVVVVGLLVILLIGGIGILIAFPVKWTWNVTMPHIFNLPTITWGKAWCLYFLCNCLIRSSSTLKQKDS